MTHEECTRVFYNDICEMYEEDCGLAPTIFDNANDYSITIATIALDENVMKFTPHYEPFKEYARAFYRSQKFAYDIEVGKFIHA